jgi:predicted dehydrogenase
MAARTVRVGFIGAGAIVRQRHVPGLRQVGEIELVGVANRSRASSERAAAEFGIQRAYDDWRELVRADDVDVVWIGTHPTTHREMTLAALEAGKHVFCQARMAPDYRDARAMWDAARTSDRTTMLCPPPHYMRGDRVIRRLLREGLVGEPRNVVVQSYSANYADPSTPIHWRQQRAISGYNTLDVGMMVEVMQRWLGYARRVSAFEKTVFPTRPNPNSGTASVERPDTLSAIAELENGALATLLFSGVARHAHDANRFEIYGSAGTIRYLYASDTILAGAAGEEDLREVPISPDEARGWTVEADFIAAVREGKRSVEPTFWDGLKYMEMTEAIFRSAETGRSVDLPFEELVRTD